MFKRRKIPSIDVDRQRKLLLELLPIAERCWEWTKALRQAGWSTMQPRIDLELSFADGEEETSQYKRTEIEVAKLWLANPNRRFYLAPGRPFVSIYLKDLQTRREEEIKTYGKPEDLPLWMREGAGVFRKLGSLRHSQPAEFDRRFKAAEDERAERRVREIARFASGMSQDFDLKNGPAAFYRAVLERESKPMHFAFDPERSAGDYIVFSRPLIEGWDLCLTPEPLIWYPALQEGPAEVCLSVQAAGHRRRRPMKGEFKWERIVILEYSPLVPHFALSYRRYKTLDELEIVIMAQMFLMSLVIDDIHAALAAGFPKIGWTADGWASQL
jgi:hypothetical protein